MTSGVMYEMSLCEQQSSVCEVYAPALLLMGWLHQQADLRLSTASSMTDSTRWDSTVSMVWQLLSPSRVKQL